ncbi:hypothetical protein K1719_002177 [Acacia pycnantha]|nr:hypothetical protein K1719_002177 [Acacia pycnantha]
MGAHSLFHCAASHAIALPLRNLNTTEKMNIGSVAGSSGEKQSNMGLKSDEVISQTEESNILAWLESFEVQDWISCIGGTIQDAMTSQIIVAAALAIWYPSLVKASIATLVVHPLMKLAMAMNEKYNSTAAELLVEGMENTTWGFAFLIGNQQTKPLLLKGLFQIAMAHSPSMPLKDYKVCSSAFACCCF